MTEHPVTDWSATFDRYRIASTALMAEMDRVEIEGAPEAVFADEAHRAAMELLYAPAQTILHVVQKIRIANKILYLRGMHPDLADMLIEDLLALVDR